MSELPKTRLTYLDNVRALVVFLVITMHVAVTYSGLGDWYYKEGTQEALSIFELVFFAYYQSFLQAWFMGILFFIAAIFAAKAYAKYGSGKFTGERLFRLGLPLLVYVFIISPIIIFIIMGVNPDDSFFDNYYRYIVNFWWPGSTGPLWFVEALLIFCLFYVLIKKFFKGIVIKNIKTINIFIVILFTGIVAFLVRLVLPIGTSIQNLQICYFPSYIVLFIGGIVISENNLLDTLTDEKNIKWIKLSILIGVPLWLLAVPAGGALEGYTYFNGGFHWQSLTYALWESLNAIGFSIGLIALFRKRVNVSNWFSNLLRENSFGIYFFHSAILIFISLVLKDLVLLPILKFLLVVIITSIACLVFTYLVRKIKPIGILLK